MQIPMKKENDNKFKWKGQKSKTTKMQNRSRKVRYTNADELIENNKIGTIE